MERYGLGQGPTSTVLLIDFSIGSTKALNGFSRMYINAQEFEGEALSFTKSSTVNLLEKRRRLLHLRSSIPTCLPFSDRLSTSTPFISEPLRGDSLCNSITRSVKHHTGTIYLLYK